MNIAERTLELKTDFDNVYKAGKEAGTQAQYDEFWDGFQNVENGVPQRTQYNNAFYQWRHKHIRPKYKIMPDSSVTTVDNMYNSCNNLLEIENVDFSNFTPKTTATSGSWYYTFGNCTQIKSFPDYNMKAGGYVQTWRNCLNLQSIKIMRCCEHGAYETPFYACSKLKHLEIEGEIGKSFPIPSSPLTCKSFKSIITHLHDYSGSFYAFTFTVTFKASAFEALEAEGATASYNGVACTWAELIDNKKWNLALAKG